MPKVLFVQRMVPDYRLPFFVCLHKTLRKLGVEFHVTTGESLPEDYLNDSVGAYPWIVEHKNHYIYKQIHIHNIQQIDDYDLVIVMQENSHLINYYLLLLRYTKGRPLIAFYGHGRNVNVLGNRIREFIKSKIALLPDWWFAYTALTERIVLDNGYPKEKITIVNNAIDDAPLKRECAEQTAKERVQLREKIGVHKNSKVALYCGRLIDIKVSFLLKALESIREKDDAFEAIIVGTGPLEETMRIYAERYDWLHYAGAVYGSERAKYFCISDVFLMPGLVGLAILDAFAAGLPIITTDCKVHSPEIEYLEQGVNGFITENSLQAYVQKIRELLGDEQTIMAMKKNARESSEKYSIEKMAGNFAVGIQQTLELIN